MKTIRLRPQPINCPLLWASAIEKPILLFLCRKYRIFFLPRIIQRNSYCAQAQPCFLAYDIHLERLELTLSTEFSASSVKESRHAPCKLDGILLLNFSLSYGAEDSHSWKGSRKDTRVFRWPPNRLQQKGGKQVKGSIWFNSSKLGKISGVVSGNDART